MFLSKHHKVYHQQIHNFLMKNFTNRKLNLRIIKKFIFYHLISNFTKNIKVKNSYFRPNALRVSKSSRKIPETARNGSNSEQNRPDKAAQNCVPFTESVRPRVYFQFTALTKIQRRQKFQHFCKNFFLMRNITFTSTNFNF